MVVDFYVSPDGSKPVADYMRTLPIQDRKRLAEMFFRIQELGLAESGADVKGIEGKLKEIRVSAHRAFFVLVTGDLMVILHAYRKKTQKAPPAEIAIAQQRMKEILEGRD